MYSYLIFHMSGEFFDSMLEHWSSTCDRENWADYYNACDFDMMYCGGGPL